MNFCQEPSVKKCRLCFSSYITLDRNSVSLSNYQPKYDTVNIMFSARANQKFNYNISSFIKYGLMDNCHPYEIKTSSIVLCLVAFLEALKIVHSSTPSDCKLAKSNQTLKQHFGYSISKSSNWILLVCVLQVWYTPTKIYTHGKQNLAKT